MEVQLTHKVSGVALTADEHSHRLVRVSVRQIRVKLDGVSF